MMKLINRTMKQDLLKINNKIIVGKSFQKTNNINKVNLYKYPIVTFLKISKMYKMKKNKTS